MEWLPVVAAILYIGELVRRAAPWAWRRFKKRGQPEQGRFWTANRGVLLSGVIPGVWLSFVSGTPQKILLSAWLVVAVMGAEYLTYRAGRESQNDTPSRKIVVDAAGVPRGRLEIFDPPVTGHPPEGKLTGLGSLLSEGQERLDWIKARAEGKTGPLVTWVTLKEAVQDWADRADEWVGASLGKVAMAQLNSSAGPGQPSLPPHAVTELFSRGNTEPLDFWNAVSRRMGWLNHFREEVKRGG